MEEERSLEQKLADINEGISHYMGMGCRGGMEELMAEKERLLEEAKKRKTPERKVLSFDAETDGLYGKTFAIAATVRQNGVEATKFEARIEDSKIKEKWVRENVLPNIQNMKITHSTSKEMEEAFWAWLQENKNDCDIIANVPYPVETGLLARCVKRDLANRQWEAPFPLFDLATVFRVKNIIPDTVHKWVESQGVPLDFNGDAHNPMFDAVVAAQAWELLLDT